jgi:hypothetical protein
LTDPASLPGGTATYKGELHGYATGADALDSVLSGKVGKVYNVSGTINANANFAAGTIGGNMNVNIAGAGLNSRNLAISNIALTNGNLDLANSGFSANLSHAAISANSAQINGSFYGPGAPEMGAAFAFKTQNHVGGSAPADLLVSGIAVAKR